MKDVQEKVIEIQRLLNLFDSADAKDKAFLSIQLTQLFMQCHQITGPMQQELIDQAIEQSPLTAVEL